MSLTIQLPILEPLALLSVSLPLLPSSTKRIIALNRFKSAETLAKLPDKSSETGCGKAATIGMGFVTKD